VPIYTNPYVGDVDLPPPMPSENAKAKAKAPTTASSPPLTGARVLQGLPPRSSHASVIKNTPPAPGASGSSLAKRPRDAGEPSESALDKRPRNTLSAGNTSKPLESMPDKRPENALATYNAGGTPESMPHEGQGSAPSDDTLGIGEMTTGLSQKLDSTMNPMIQSQLFAAQMQMRLSLIQAYVEVSKSAASAVATASQKS